MMRLNWDLIYFMVSLNQVPTEKERRLEWKNNTFRIWADWSVTLGFSVVTMTTHLTVGEKEIKI